MDKTIQEGKEGSILFNDALNTFYLQLCGIGHMLLTIIVKEPFSL